MRKPRKEAAKKGAEENNPLPRKKFAVGSCQKRGHSSHSGSVSAPGDRKKLGVVDILLALYMGEKEEDPSNLKWKEIDIQNLRGRPK